MLLHAQDEESGRRMSDRQLRDEVMTLFMAGHETTANTLAWAWVLLSAHPKQRPGSMPRSTRLWVSDLPTYADLPRLKYAENVINETLRVYPTVWVIGREAIEPGRTRRVFHSCRDDSLHAAVGHPPRWSLVSKIPRHSVPNGGKGDSCSGFIVMPISRSAAGPESASATTSP